MRRNLPLWLGIASFLSAGTLGAIGCNATTGSRSFGDGGAGADNTGQGASGASQSTSAGDGLGGGFVTSGPTSAATGSGMCNTDPTIDDDGDGLSEAQGDCNDCDKNVSPGSIEVPTNPMDPLAQPSDEDCDGAVDNVKPTVCDDNLALDDKDAKNGARAIDLCQFTTGADKTWGVLAARYVKANGAPRSTPGEEIGILPNFGPKVNPQGGSRILGLSSGHARIMNQQGACGLNSCYTTGPGQPPPGFPQSTSGCPGNTDINDDIGLEVRIRSPRNATGYGFKFKFYTFEYPEWLCQEYNDQFIALVNPAPPGSINGNVSFDNKNNPVSVNVAFFDVCDGCPLGPSEMEGTGFNTWNNAGGTGWLQTLAPINGGDEVIIRFAIWDTGDQDWDSTALVDGFTWIANGGTVVVGTDPIENPK